MLDNNEKEILECLVRGWINSDLPLYGGLSYQAVMDLVQKLGGDPKPIELHLNKMMAKYN